MRIALISEHASPLACLGGVDSGGQNVYVGQVASQLAARGHEVDIFTRRDCASLPEQVEWRPGARVIHVPAGPPRSLPKERLLPLMDAFSAWVQAFCLREGAYDVVHANFFMSALVASDLKRGLGIPYVVTFHALGRVRRLHQGAADGFPPERETIEEAVIEEADQIIAECPQDRSDLIEHYGARRQKLAVIPCGFDPAEFWPIDRRAARRELGLPEDEVLILQLGRMVPRKGVETVIRGMAALRRQVNAPCRLLLVGGETREPSPAATPEIGRLQRICKELGVERQVEFVGSRRRDELKTWYSAADIFATVPWYEPFGITPLEAMACGLPVVGSAVGGIKMTVADGQTGYLVPPQDHAALADRLATLVKTPELRASLGRRAIARVHRLFTWERVCDAIEQVYSKVVHPCPPVAFPQLAIDAPFRIGLASSSSP